MRIRFRHLLTVSTLALLSACGGDSPPPEADAVVADTLIRPMEREPLTEADMSGLSMADLSVQLPWSGNRVSRDGTPSAAAATLVSMQTSAEDGFTRALFEFGTTTPFPGYQVDLMQGDAGVSCSEDSDPVSVSGTRLVVIGFAPARADDHRAGMTGGRGGFVESGIVCNTPGWVVWAAGMSDASEVRVFELRNPPRLAVDIR